MAKIPDNRLSRREAMSALGAGAAAMWSGHAFATSMSTPTLETARGVVFEDRLLKGRRSAGDPGIAGVLVSNGCDVVATDRDGKWSLPVAPGDNIFMIKPPHWSTARGVGASAFSYLHQPAGSPPLAQGAPAVAPTGPLPISIDFSLRRCHEQSQFDALLLADTQAASAAELAYVRHDLMTCVADQKRAAFALHHGDAMGDDLSLLMRYRDILDETGVDWHHCPGNHDLNLDAADPAFALESWKQTIGPPHYAFQYAGAVFFLLNNVEVLGHHETLADSRRYRGRIGSRQLRFVENVLRNISQDALVVVSTHIPLASFDAPGSVSDTTADGAALLKLLSCRPHTISFAGHSHTTEHHNLCRAHGFARDAPHRHQVLTAACGSWWSGPCDARGVPIADSRDGSPRGYHVLTVDGNRAETRFVGFANDRGGDEQMRVMLTSRRDPDRVLERPLASAELAEAEVVVNGFDGGPGTDVTMNITGCDSGPITLARIERTDPHIVDIFARHRALYKPWVAPARSSHIWTAPLPQNLTAGAHDVIVRVTGEYGRTSTAQLKIEITN